MERQIEKNVMGKRKMGACGGLNNTAMNRGDDSRLTDCLNEIKVFQKTE